MRCIRRRRDQGPEYSVLYHQLKYSRCCARRCALPDAVAPTYDWLRRATPTDVLYLAALHAALSTTDSTKHKTKRDNKLGTFLMTHTFTRHTRDTSPMHASARRNGSVMSACCITRRSRASACARLARRPLSSLYCPNELKKRTGKKGSEGDAPGSLGGARETARSVRCEAEPAYSLGL